MKKFSAIFLIFLFLVSACSRPPVPKRQKSPSSSGAKEGGKINFRIRSEPPSLNPYTTNDYYASTILGNIYESLLTRDNETMAFKGQLADTWTISSDYMTFTFHLRHDVKFHDGVPMTARDVKFTFDKLMDPKVDAGPYRNYYQDIKKLEVIDTYTVRFRYKKRYFKALGVCGGLEVMPEHIFSKGDFNAHPNNRKPIGTGPYKFSKWRTRQFVKLIRNENYYDKKPFIKEVNFRLITDANAALLEMRSGKIDSMILESIQWTKQTADAGFMKRNKKWKRPDSVYRYIGWNEERPFFKDKRVRRALTMLMDRQKIVDKILNGLGQVITGPLYPQSPSYDKSVQPWHYDPKAAVKLLDKAGWKDHDGDGLRDKDGVPFKFEFLISSGRDLYEKIAVLMKENFGKVGIRVTVRRLEWATFTRFLHLHKFDATCLGWAMPIVDNDPYQVWHSSQIKGGSNYISYRNPEVDKLLEEARGEFDEAKRTALYKKFHRILHEDQPYTFLFSPDELMAISRRFGGIKQYPGGYDFHEWYVK